MPRRILFVDDDFNAIQGFKRMVHSLSSEWIFQFAAGGSDALRIMGEQPFDVIISDMRMPGMDGAELLQIVMKKFPHVVRIILSGYSDPETVLRSIGPVHRFLAKPCAADNLFATISQVLTALDWVSDYHVKKMVAGISVLPVSQLAYRNLTMELVNPCGSLAKAGDLMLRDSTMVALNLKLASSEILGLPRHVGDIRQVFEQIGWETIKKFILDQNNFCLEASPVLPEKLLLEAINNHSFAVSRLAGEIAKNAEQHSGYLTSLAAVTGMLHDIGRVILFGCPELYQKVIHYAATRECSLCEAEYRILGTTHAKLGACLLGLWGLPEPIVQAVAYHHYLPRKTTPFSVGTAIQLAEVLVKGLPEKQMPPEGEFLKSLGLKWVELNWIIA